MYCEYCGTGGDCAVCRSMQPDDPPIALCPLPTSADLFGVTLPAWVRVLAAVAVVGASLAVLALGLFGYLGF